MASSDPTSSDVGPALTRETALDIAHRVLRARYPQAACAVAAGSGVRGEGRPRSDVDLVVVFPTVARAVRESFVFDAVPVEAFVYDRSSLRWFFHNDAANGAPSILSMVAEGVAIGDPAVAASLKAEADALLAAGPPPLAPDALARLRYEIGETLDDLRDDRPAPERMAAGVALYVKLGALALRRRGAWTGVGKWLPRRLAAADPALAATFAAAFAHLFRDGDPAAALRLAEDELAAVGGALFAGYRVEADASWRVEG